MFFGKSEMKVRDRMLEHVDAVKAALRQLPVVLDTYAETPEKLEDSTYEVHRLEHKADDLRRAIQHELAGGAFLPFYREDYITLADMIDKVANRAVAFAKALSLERPNIPADIREGLREIAVCTAETFAHFDRIIPALFGNQGDTLQLTELISEGEQKADSLEWKLQKAIFGNPAIDRAEQVILAGVIQRLSGILDSIENAADKVRLIVVKKA